MPRRRLESLEPAIPESTPAKKTRKPAAKKAPAVRFAVAPTSPFFPSTIKAKPKLENSVLATPSIALTPGTPSAHVIDLRVRPAPIRKREVTTAGFASVTVPRTLSNRQNSSVVWNGRALVTFFKFFGYLGYGLLLGIGKLLILPLVVGLRVVDKHFDLDRAFISDKDTVVATEVSKTTETKTVFTPRPLNLKRALVSFAGTALAIVLPFQALSTYRSLAEIKEQAVTAGSAGASVLRDAKNGALPDAAALAEAGAAFKTAHESVERIGTLGNALLTHLPGIGSQFRSGKALLTAGENLTEAGPLLTSALAVFDDHDLSFVTKVARVQELATEAFPLLDSAAVNLASVDELPAGISKEEFEKAKNAVTQIHTLTNEFLNLAPSIRMLLGENQEKRFLVLFQNNAELRPTGGFIGSFALVDVDRGRIKKIEVPAGGSYDLQGSQRARVLSPEPLRLISTNWQFQDANWFPDFPTSAKKLMWFYSQSAGPSVDGVVSINAPVLSALLDAVGPIGMPDYGVTATGGSVLKVAQQIVESDEARATGKPKQFIADLLPRVLDKVLTSDQSTALRTLTIFGDALQQKDIQFYWADETAQAAFDEHSWTGRLSPLPTGFDTIGVVRANIAGQKTDAVMDTHVQHQSRIDTNGTITDTATITLTHTGKKGEEFTGVRNVTYLRLYVPEGSVLTAVAGDVRAPDAKLFDIPPEGYGPDQLLSEVTGAVMHDLATGVAVNNEFNRTVFGAWLQTDPGATSTITFTYTLPFTVLPEPVSPNILERLGFTETRVHGVPFGLLIAKQSGAERTEITSELILPDGWYPTAAAPPGIGASNGWRFTTLLTTDRAIGALITKD